MTYVEMTELFKNFGLTFDPPVRDGMYWVYYLDEPFCGVEKHRKVNRSVIFSTNYPSRNDYIKEVTTEDMSNRIKEFILKTKQKNLDAALKQINSDF